MCTGNRRPTHWRAGWRCLASAVRLHRTAGRAHRLTLTSSLTLPQQQNNDFAAAKNFNCSGDDSGNTIVTWVSELGVTYYVQLTRVQSNFAGTTTVTFTGSTIDPAVTEVPGARVRGWLRPGAEVPRGAYVCANLTLVFLPYPRAECFVVPTKAPTKAPTSPPTKAPTKPPTKPPTKAPTKPPTNAPTKSPTDSPSASPSDLPTRSPTETPTAAPTQLPTGACPIGTTYWVYDPVNKPTRRLVNNTVTCLAHPYNLEVRPCRNNATVTQDRYVRIRLVDVARTLALLLFGPSAPASGDPVPASPKALPNGVYYLGTMGSSGMGPTRVHATLSVSHRREGEEEVRGESVKYERTQKREGRWRNRRRAFLLSNRAAGAAAH
jgi:hypothetical protein